MNRVALPAHLKSRILETTKRENSPTRKSVQRSNAVILATSLALTLNVFLAVGGTRGDPRPDPLALGTLLGWLSLAIAATWGALGRGGSMEGRSRRDLGLVAAGVPAAAWAWMVAWAARYPAIAASLPPTDASWCFLLSWALSLPVFFALAWVRWDADVRHPRATGAALGAAGGAWGGVFLNAHCPSLGLVHQALGHALPIAVLVLLGGLWGRGLARSRISRFSM
jgi:hypothetical protein